MPDDERPFCHDGIWTAYAGTRPLCESCAQRNWDPRIAVMCLVDPKRVTAWTCRLYSREPGIEG